MKRYQLVIPAIEMSADNNSLSALKKLAKSTSKKFGVVLCCYIEDTVTKDVVFFSKPGCYYTLSDLPKISVRLYNGLHRSLVSLGFGSDEAKTKVTLRDIREMLLDEKLTDIPNCGGKAYDELYQLLCDYCGCNRTTKLAIRINRELRADDWMKRNPGKILPEYLDPWTDWWQIL